MFTTTNSPDEHTPCVIITTKDPSILMDLTINIPGITIPICTTEEYATKTFKSIVVVVNAAAIAAPTMQIHRSIFRGIVKTSPVISVISPQRLILGGTEKLKMIRIQLT